MTESTESIAPPVAAIAAPDAAPHPPSTPPAPRFRYRAALIWSLLTVAVVAGLWYWHRSDEQAERARDADRALQLEALQSRVESLRRDSRSHAQRLQQADATNRVLRDELLGMGQRAALLEQQIARLADANLHGAQAMRMDEAELLLTLGQQRLRLAADLDGARHAYALAAEVLAAIDNPEMLNLRQALAQERAALDALDADPRRQALRRLDAFIQALPADTPTRTVAAVDPQAPWWDRVLSRLVQVRRVDDSVAISGQDRAGAKVALELELSLARTAIERRDTESYRAALTRAGTWLPRLWPASQARQTELFHLRELPLELDMPTLGSTLQLLRAQRETR